MNPRLTEKKPSQPPEPAPVEPVVQILREQIVVKETAPPRAWRFVPYRDENNLIVEIIATPIE